ncbi:MAG: hypothetical protein GWN87_09190, partial [Desulfuromonadales bacterium]|nr:hypothetical protein [Desulfuromonadales bacterium]
MVWLDICDDQGNAIYFDVHHVARRRVARRWRHSVSGTCGNGQFEVEVLVEPAGVGEVTFVDLSGGTSARSALMGGVSSSALESSLLAAAERHCGMPKSTRQQHRPYPHAARKELLTVQEKGP